MTFSKSLLQSIIFEGYLSPTKHLLTQNWYAAKPSHKYDIKLKHLPMSNRGEY